MPVASSDPNIQQEARDGTKETAQTDEKAVSEEFRHGGPLITPRELADGDELVAAPAGLSCGPLEIDPGTMSATLCDNRLDLTAREFAILSLLARNIGLPVTRSMLWSICWSTYNFVPANFANTIDVHVSRLRRKLELAGTDLPATLSPMIVAVRSQPHESCVKGM